MNTPEHSEALEGLFNKINDVIDAETRGHGFMVLEVMGTLECLKANIMNLSIMEGRKHGE